MRALFISGMEHSGLPDAVKHESAGNILLENAPEWEEGLAALRRENFDAVLVFHEPTRRDALEMTEALRTAGIQLPILILGRFPASEMLILALDSGAEDYVHISTITVRDLVWLIARAARQNTWKRENVSLKQERYLRISREHEDARNHISQQQEILQRLSPGSEIRTETKTLPTAFQDHYRQLLKTYVLMGTGNLNSEIRDFCAAISEAEIPAERLMAFHLEVLENSLEHFSTKSCQHFMRRAELLRLEVLIHLADRGGRRSEQMNR